MQLDLADNMKEIRSYVEQGDTEAALRLSAELVQCADERADSADEEHEYYSFSEFFEEIVVKEFWKPEREVVRTEFPFADVYYQHGVLLNSEERYEEAREVLAKARRWNPVSALIAFSYMDTFRFTGQMEEFVELNREIFPYLFRSADVAEGYSNFAGYFVGQQQWRLAAACCRRSLYYEPGESGVEKLLGEIKKMAGSDYSSMKEKEMKKLLEKANVPSEPNPNLINLAVGLGEQFMSQQIFEGAMYCFKVVYGLTKDEKVGELVSQMRLITE